jgi:uncharacterized membrane protein required for colicin V production
MQRKAEGGMDKIKALFDAIEHNHLILTFGGVVGALLGAMQKKLGFIPALASMILGGSCAAVIGPWLVEVISDKASPAVYSFIGFMIGLLIKEVTEIVFKVLDQIEQDPAFITDFIKRKAKRK